MSIPVAMTKSAASGKASVFTSSQTNTLSLDTLGFDHASIDVIFGPAASTSSVAQTLTLKQGDTSVGATENVTGFTGDLKPAIYAGQTVATQMTITRLEVDCRGKKRWLAVAASPNTDTVIVISARLSRGEEGPYDAGTKGVSVNVAG
jgi:hypothetical protein